MGRRRKDANTEDLISLETGGGHNQKLLDPTAALPGAIKQVSNQKPLEPDALERAKEDLRRKYRLFLQRYRLELARSETNFDLPGNPLVRALAETFGISIEQAWDRQHDLHAQMVEASKGVSISELMRRHGLSQEARVAILSHHANSLDPKVSLVAIKVANEMDDAGGASAADSFEAWLDVIGAD